jgi:acetyl-CoA carboxylase biotin carboxylase subunit
LKIKKLLVANRGEISLRILRTAQELGIKTVAVYSDADKSAPHVRFADEAVNLGPAPASASYLDMDKIISVAKALGVDAIHPGYGFLSENAGFAKKTKQAGIIFIGPSPEAMAIMGSKLAAKKAVASYGIPLVPGTDKAIQDIDDAKKAAKRIGYPVLVKASAGGGGKGMRIVNSEKELEEQMQRAIGEARSSFGDPSVFLEKLIQSPKHIEIQVLADQHGNIIHLFERECSIQRRHQKVIEEAPSAVVGPKMRMKMGEAAIGVARACAYEGAGTVEFIVDEDLNYYFLEMNTRLQVEHPVTEMITGVDLVREQINIAEGHPLNLKQETLKINGHAIEIRVYAEDPQNGFLPDTGFLKTYKTPKGPGIRIDDGFEEGMEIPIHYDPMIAKLIVHGVDRQSAIKRMKRAIDEYRISGIKTTLGFCQWVMDHPVFKNGEFTTNFIPDYFKPEVLDDILTQEETVILAAFCSRQFKPLNPESQNTDPEKTQNETSAWKKKRLSF